MRFLRTRAALLTVLLLGGLVSPASAGPSDPDPLGLLPAGEATEALGLGTDVITVWVCSGFAGNVQTFTPTEVAQWANTQVVPFYAAISRGRFTPQFVAGGEFTVAGMNPDRCLEEATKRTTAGSNAMVIDRSTSGTGFGGPGSLVLDANNDVVPSDLTAPASQTTRGFYLGGGAYGRPAAAAHELGHTLAWPHSGSTNTGSAAGDYDNLIDLMSGAATDFPTWDNYCSGVGPCNIVHSLAINRYASGWVDVGEIAVVARSGVSVDLAGPEASGVQLALVPTVDPLKYLTVEARPATGYDSIMPVEGVVVHRVDLTQPCQVGGANYPVCWGILRRQSPAVSAVLSDAHVIGVGQSLLVDGVAISVGAATATGFRATFTGDPAGCAMGPNPYDDLSTGSYAFASVGCIRVLGITYGTSPTTYSPLQNVTREQMAAFLQRLYEALGNTCGGTPGEFVDVPASSFAYQSVACIKNLGVTTGTGPNTYAPADTVTREQMAAFLARLWRALGNACSTASTPFTDVPATSYAVADVACIYHLGITTGTSSSTYAPAGPVTREQMAAFLARFWEAATA